MTDAIRDNNHETVMLGVSSTDSTTPVPFEVDPVTGRLKTDSSGAGYSNLTQFVDQTAWRIFYSDANGNVQELAIGASGTVLTSQGATSVPTWSASSAGVDTSGTPVANDYARFTDADTIEGRSYSEVKADLGLDTTDSVQFNDVTQKFSTETVTALGNLGATEAIDWSAGTYFTGTLDSDVTITHTNEAEGRSITIFLTYDGSAQRTITWSDVDEWANGEAPTAPSTTDKETVVTLTRVGTTVYGFHNTSNNSDHGALSGLSDDDHTQYSLISSGAGAPGSTPSRVGEIYIDTTNDNAYVSTGTASSSDWTLVSGSSSDHGALTGLSDDDHTQYSLISSGAGVPGSTPTRVGEVYIDTTNDTAYISTDTASSADWTLVSGSSSDHGSLTGLSDDDHTQYSIISTGAGVPGSTPTREGAIYVDTTNDNIYIASDTASSADWEQVNGAGVSDHGSLTGLGDDDHTQYNIIDEAAGSAAPSSAPSRVGATYFDTTNNKIYLALGTTDASDWWEITNLTQVVPSTDSMVYEDGTNNMVFEDGTNNMIFE